MKWSFTKLSTFLQCPKKYEHQYLNKYPFTTNEALVIGNAWGKGMEEYALSFSKRKAWDLIEKGVTHYIIKDQEKVKNQLLCLFNLYLDKYALKPLYYEGKPMVEYSFNFRTPNNNSFMGRIDIVTQRKAVVDYKTSEKRYDPKYCSDPLSGKGLQLTAYAKVYYDLFKTLPLITGWQVAIKSELKIENVLLPITLADINGFLKLVDDTSKKLENKRTFEKIPQALCAYCDFWKDCYGTIENRDRIVRESRSSWTPTGSNF